MSTENEPNICPVFVNIHKKVLDEQLYIDPDLPILCFILLPLRGILRRIGNADVGTRNSGKIVDNQPVLTLPEYSGYCNRNGRGGLRGSNSKVF